MIDATARLVFTSGLIYSAQFPFSTTVIVDNGKIAWLGDEEGLAGQLLDTDIQIDLGGAFVSPGFFDAQLTTLNPSDQGIAAGIVGGQAQAQLVVRDVSRALVAAREPISPNPSTVTLGPRLLSEQDVAALVSDRAFVIADASSRPATARQLAAAGIPFAFGSNGRQTIVWEWIRGMVFGDVDGLSARAAFNAATRSGWRYAGYPDAGQLTIGSTATFNVWTCDQFEVQVPDSRVSAWSTDARAGTPPLPDLSPGATLPVLEATVVCGDLQRVG